METLGARLVIQCRIPGGTLRLPFARASGILVVYEVQS
jgi:hypothetical protein